MGIIRWIAGFLVTIAVATFAVMNDSSVNFTYSPFHPPIELPVYLIFLGFMAFGFLFGSVVTWFNGSSARKERRRQKKEIRVLEKEIERLKQDKLASKTPPAADMFPAIASQ